MAKQIQPEFLYRRFLNGECSREEVLRLIAYFGTADEESLHALIRAELAEQEEEVAIAGEAEKLAELKKRIDVRIGSGNGARTIRLWPRIAVAASVLIAVSISAYFFLRSKKTEQVMVTKVEQDIRPGGNKAYLTLGNGQRISLTDAKNGAIASQGGQTIRKTADGKVEYDDSHYNHTDAEMVYNTIETPRGGQYQVVLPDGSKVWLNAASSLRYPAAFVGAERKVELIGEAYFEVAKDKLHPFKVTMAQETVEVLGTHFNINSYSDEPSLKTTLLEGSVKVSTAAVQRVIKPGEQAVLNAAGLKVQDADEEEVLAWKNGLFVFNDEPLESIMRKVSRWYDVDVQYSGDVDKAETFGGGLPRFSNVSKVLKQLESTRLVHFKLQGRVIYVTR
ncbi:FecR family protein [Mucilaginibacter litoreus]|uniref:FecR family protein n=1 Tax=Mucilaginibacter litoreus TaxID=1048221 RepID=A0ABW3AM06_9SPHI